MGGEIPSRLLVLKHSPVEHILFSLKVCLADSSKILCKMNKHFERQVEKDQIILGHFTPFMKELLLSLIMPFQSKHSWSEAHSENI